MRPNTDDAEMLDLLLADDRLDPRSAQFIEDLASVDSWSVKQCQWFDQLVGKYHP